MKRYLSKHEAVIDLHERGFCHDFQLVGNDLLWLQEKTFVRAGDFIIMEFYRFGDADTKETEMIVFGILAFYHNVKGILIRHLNKYIVKTAPVITKKLNDMLVQQGSTLMHQ